ncbi:MAG: DUF6261 family protein, partial [Mediterranea sp.]|nr:DUF6261 family protein [Mediterranea sp.]
MKNILSARLSRLHNGEHFGFEEAVLGTLTPSLAGHLNLTAQRGQLRQLHDREAEVYRINQAYRQTKELARLDLFRDKTFNYIKNSVKYYLNTGDNAKKTAAAAVNFVLRPYRLDPVKGYIDNTADMGKFVDDMSVKPYPAHIATLGLT